MAREATKAKWDMEADVVIIGSGAAGLSAAIVAIDSGASVIVVESNYDIRQFPEAVHMVRVQSLVERCLDLIG